MTPQSATAMQPTKAVGTSKQDIDIFGRANQIFDSISQRAFNLFESNGRWHGHDLEDWFRAESELLHPLHLEVIESEDKLTIHAEVPGFNSKELDIEIEPRRLTIAGNREAKNENTKGGRVDHSEWCADQILKVVDLPKEVDSSKATATLKDGILTIDVAKLPNTKPIKVIPRTA